jgi:hypothetical protein
MSSTRIAYSQRPDVTPETEVSVLAAIYKLAINSHARKEATRPGSPDDGTKVKEDSANEHRST